MLKAFVSYSHEDERMKNRLLKQIRPLERNGLISCWHDYKIPPGGQIDPAIKKAMEDTDLFLLCLSGPALFSEYIWSVEIKEAVHRHREKTAIVIPIIMRPCLWASVESISSLKALPKDAKAVSDWRPHDNGYHDIAQNLYKMLSKFASKP